MSNWFCLLSEKGSKVNNLLNSFPKADPFQKGLNV